MSLLSLLTRLQLNLLGRKSYVATITFQALSSSQNQAIGLEDRVNGRPQPLNGDDFELNRKYLAFSWWFLHKGWKEIMVRVETAVIEVFGPIKPTEDIPLVTLSSLILTVRRMVEGANPDERRYGFAIPIHA